MAVHALWAVRIGKRPEGASDGAGSASPSTVLGSAAGSQRHHARLAFALRHLSGGWRHRSRQHLVFAYVATNEAATEAIFLLMQYAMDKLKYQRLVWRCSRDNQASLNAAARYGFVPEGAWRGSALIKGRRHDEVWHSILAAEWPARRAAIGAWLADDNFDRGGRAHTRLVIPA